MHHTEKEIFPVVREQSPFVVRETFFPFLGDACRKKFAKQVLEACMQSWTRPLHEGHLPPKSILSESYYQVTYSSVLSMWLILRGKPSADHRLAPGWPSALKGFVKAVLACMRMDVRKDGGLTHGWPAAHRGRQTAA